MTQAITWPKYPRISWRPTLTGTVQVTANGSPAGSAIDLSAFTGHGYADNTSNVAVNGSMHYELAQAIGSRLTAALGSTITVACSYVWTGSPQGPMFTRYSAILGGNTASFAFSTTAAARQFGFASTSANTLGIISPTSVYESAGSWAPKVTGGSSMVELLDSRPIAQAESLDGTACDAVAWGSDLYVRTLDVGAVRAANVAAKWADISAYADAAERSASDPNALLEQLLAHARTPVDNQAPTLRFYTAPGVYESVRLQRPGRALADVAKPDGPPDRLFRVNLAFRAIP